MGGIDPRIRQQPDSKKATPPGSVPDVEPLAKEPLSWQLSQIDFGGSWSWSKLDPGHVERLHKQLLDYERSSLATLKRQQRARQIPVEHLCLAARNRLLAIRRDDAELWELRLGHGKWRAWGTIQGSIFYLLWWDPEHTVCQELPKRMRRPGR
jgi:hypothetical protein